MEKIKFSVIVPVYNVEKYLKECLDSIFAYKGDLEVIAVDDGSTDSSGKILDEYPDERLKVYHKENEGVFKTWQYGVKKSTGEYIIFVDSDDYIDSKLFPDVLEILSERDYDLIQFGWTHVFRKKNEVNRGFVRFQNGALEGEELQKYLEETLYQPSSMENFFPSTRWGKVYRAELLKALLPELIENIVWFEDDSTTLPFLTTIRSLYMTEKPYYFYRIGRTDSLCNDSRKARENWVNCQNLLKYFEGFHGGVLTKNWGDFFIGRNHMEVLISAINAKDRKLCEEILSDERFQNVINQGKGLKYFLIRHKMFGTFSFLRKVKMRLKRQT